MKDFITIIIFSLVVSILVSVPITMLFFSIRREPKCDEYKNGICKTILSDGRTCYATSGYIRSDIWCEERK